MMVIHYAELFADILLAPRKGDAREETEQVLPKGDEGTKRTSGVALRGHLCKVKVTSPS